MDDVLEGRGKRGNGNKLQRAEKNACASISGLF